MTRSLTISSVQFSAGTPAMVAQGLLGFVSVTVNGSLRLDGLALRKTRDGRLALSFPARRDGSGRQHPLVRPVDDPTRREIERQTFEALGIQESATP